MFTSVALREPQGDMKIGLRGDIGDYVGRTSTPLSVTMEYYSG